MCSESRISVARAVLIVIALLSAITPLTAQIRGCPDERTEIRQAVAGHTVIETYVPTRDHVWLNTLVYLPAGQEEPLPAIIVRTPYDLPVSPFGGMEPQSNEDAEADAKDVGWPELTDAGYAFVIQQTRGRQSSGGEDDLLLAAGSDGLDLIDWVIAQPWSNGRVGLAGDSITGVLAMLTAAQGHPAIQAVFSQASTANFVGDFLMPDGRLKLETFLIWTLAQSFEASDAHLQTLGLGEDEIGGLFGQAGAMLGDLFDGLEDPAGSEAWMTPVTADYPVISELLPIWRTYVESKDRFWLEDRFDARRRLNVPIYFVTLWQDVFQNGTMKDFTTLQERNGRQKLLVLDGAHYEIDDPEKWPVRPFFDWFDHWLKDEPTGIMDQGAVRYVTAGDRSEVLEAASWPPTRARARTFWATADGRLAKRPEDSETQLPLAYRAANPMPTHGGKHLVAPAGNLDQSILLAASRDDLLTFESGPIGGSRLILGQPEVALTVQADRLPADVVVKLVERTVSGEMKLILENIAHLRCDGNDKMRVRIGMGHIAYRLEPGSRLQLWVTASSFPGWERGEEDIDYRFFFGGDNVAQLRVPFDIFRNFKE